MYVSSTFGYFYHLVNVISYGPAASTKATCNNYPEMDQSLVDKH